MFNRFPIKPQVMASDDDNPRAGSHARTVPKKKAGGVGSRTQYRSRRKPTNSQTEDTDVKQQAVSSSDKWSLEGKTNKQISKKIKQLSESRDYWKERTELD